MHRRNRASHAPRRQAGIPAGQPPRLETDAGRQTILPPTVENRRCQVFAPILFPTVAA
jgi:hypothetical protein